MDLATIGRQIQDMVNKAVEGADEFSQSALDSLRQMEKTLKRQQQKQAMKSALNSKISAHVEELKPDLKKGSQLISSAEGTFVSV